MSGWWAAWAARWQARREEQVLRHRPIPEALWQGCVARHAFLSQRNPADLGALRRLATLFLARKEFTGAGGLVPTDEMVVSIAAQACLPILHFGLASYDGFVGIVVHPDEVVAQREVVDDDGVVHHYEETLSGEAMEGGPVMLSWRDVDAASEPGDRGYNVVIHEFAHVLDMRDGQADGIPPLPNRAARDHWERVLLAEHRAFCDALDADPQADPVIDPYGAEAPEEFFAVASEAFFVTPLEMRQDHPLLYDLLAGYFRQDPATQFAAQPR
jgi:Mlc titration factor MtfA (ptsG expression regulator)